MNKAYLIIGGNMGNRLLILAQARESIGDACGKIIIQSSVYETAAWGKEDQEAFLNQVILIETQLSSPDLLQSILKIEEKLGRKRLMKYGPRIIDIDILFFNDDVINIEGLKVPHPQMQNRRFVLLPLNEIAPHIFHPILKKNVSQLLADCPDTLAVNKFS
ncbi:MAG: 2-amino-4-hydroxy-6-hydroxymethyldihydropteridine diphosphokinase [Flavisolibacter sp.]